MTCEVETDRVLRTIGT